MMNSNKMQVEGEDDGNVMGRGCIGRSVKTKDLCNDH